MSRSFWRATIDFEIEDRGYRVTDTTVRTWLGTALTRTDQLGLTATHVQVGYVHSATTTQKPSPPKPPTPTTKRKLRR